MMDLQMPNFETITIPNFLETEESKNFFLNAYIEFANELSDYAKNAKPKMTQEKDKVLLEGDYDFSECGIRVSSYKRIMIYFEEYNGVKYLCKRTFKNEVRHISWMNRNVFTVLDTLELFDGDLKVAERVYSEGYSKEAAYILQPYFIDFLGLVHVKDILNHENLFIWLPNDGRVNEMDGYEVKNINRVQYHKDGVMLTTIQNDINKKVDKTTLKEECNYYQELSCVDWNRINDFNPRITEIWRAKIDFQTGKFDDAGKGYATMQEAYRYWSQKYKKYVDDQNDKRKDFHL